MRSLTVAILGLALANCSLAPPIVVEPERLHNRLKEYYYSKEQRRILVNDYHGVAEELPLPHCDSPRMCGAIVQIRCVSQGLEINDYLDNTTGDLLEMCGGSCFVGIALKAKHCERKCPPTEWKCR